MPVSNVTKELGFALYNSTMPLHEDTEQQFLPDAVDGNVTGLPPPPDRPAAAPEAIIGLSLLFCAVGVIGLVGNFLIIYVILADRKMRRSATNIFIINLAVADFFIMALGVPEIIQFMLNRGWILGTPLCKAFRYILVFSLYASVLTLVGVCVERYVVIFFCFCQHISFHFSRRLYGEVRLVLAIHR